tara:strand:- start:676 stop:1467 length:792 start_codon:yes stop_codon:yes gene_type:complete
MQEYWGTAEGWKVTPAEVPFYGSDTKELYYENIDFNLDKLEKNGWIHHEPSIDDRVIGYKYDYNPDKPEINDWVNLSYRINEHGFRGEEMPTEPKKRSVLCIGGSNTFGLGMPEGKLWTTLVGQSMKVRAYNIGMINGTLDSAFRVLMYWLPKIKPSHVFLLDDMQGYEYHTRSGLVKLYDNPIPCTDDNRIIQKEMAMRSITSLCEQFKTPLITDAGNGDDYFSIFEGSELDLARDLEHYGSKRHIHIAMNMLAKAGYEWDV